MLVSIPALVTDPAPPVKVISSAVRMMSLPLATETLALKKTLTVERLMLLAVTAA